LDLIDLIDTGEFLKSQEIEQDAKTLLGVITEPKREEKPEDAKAARVHQFVVQAACRHLGKMQVQEAKPRLRELSQSKDYFIAKHARKALELLKGDAEAIDRHTIPADVQRLLPEKMHSVIAFPGISAANVKGLAQSLPIELLVLRFVEEIGNLEIDRLAAVGEDLPTSKNTVRLILFTGYFDQEALVQVVSNLGGKADESDDRHWVGEVTNPDLPFQLKIALVDGRCAALSLKVDAFDSVELLQLAKAFGADP
jgi:hypothetical protein